LTETKPAGQPGASAAPGLVEHFFRREYGRLVAILTRRAGVRHLDIVEDAVQRVLLAGLMVWTDRGVPEDPGAWLYRVAYNNLIGDLRRRSGRLGILEQAVDSVAEADEHLPPLSHFAGEVADDTLRMLFVCCDDAIPRESQLVFALKTLCGFSVAEIAFRPFTSEANVYKRLTRARDRLRAIAPELETPPLDSLRSRLPSVHAVLYLLFNEGYLSVRPEEAIAASCATRPCGWPRSWRSTPLARSLRPSPCSRLCTCMRRDWGRDEMRRAACCCSRSRTGPCVIANGCSSGRNG
jgi:RNA polymerase sigma factor (sigma-70 family)